MSQKMAYGSQAQFKNLNNYKNDSLDSNRRQLNAFKGGKLSKLDMNTHYQLQ